MSYKHVPPTSSYDMLLRLLFTYTSMLQCSSVLYESVVCYNSTRYRRLPFVCYSSYVNI